MLFVFRRRPTAICFPTGQRPHFTGVGFTKTLLKEVKRLGFTGSDWTCRVWCEISVFWYALPLEVFAYS